MYYQLESKVEKESAI